MKIIKKYHKNREKKYLRCHPKKVELVGFPEARFFCWPRLEQRGKVQTRLLHQ